MEGSAPAAAESLEARIVAAALELGFCRVGFAPAEPSEQAAKRLHDWLDAGLHGEMAYMPGETDRASPMGLLPNAKSVVVVALSYADERLAVLRRSATAAPPPLTGRIARYAQREDYHRVLRSKLERLGERIESFCERPVARRACVDSAPLLERDFAERAGIGFSAKSTMTIAPGAGSFVLLGELLLDIELEPSRAVRPGCGSCTRCLSACPTSALVTPYVLDARRCISYLTIELKGAIPRALRSLIGDHVFGCDICQDVCPWNHGRRPTTDPELAPRAELQAPALVELLFLTSSGYRKLVRGSALARVSRARLARNAAVALGNSKSSRAEAPLARALLEHSSALVREHAAWALGELGFSLSRGLSALEHAALHDPMNEVRAEATHALERLRARGDAGALASALRHEHAARTVEAGARVS
jgi:epoxyqueuosine reductase